MWITRNGIFFWNGGEEWYSGRKDIPCFLLPSHTHPAPPHSHLHDTDPTMRGGIHMQDFINIKLVHRWWIYCGFANHEALRMKYWRRLHLCNLLPWIQPHELCGTWEHCFRERVWVWRGPKIAYDPSQLRSRVSETSNMVLRRGRFKFTA